MWERLMSGIILAPVVVLLLWAGGPLFFLFMLLSLGAALYEWGRMSAAGDRFLADIITGLFYLPVSFLSFYALREWFESGFFLSVVLILTVWASDTGAYFTGISLKGPKMAPAISPNKTWSGLGGAMFFSGIAIFICMLFAKFLPVSISLTMFDMFFGFLAGLFLGLIGQAGDLYISSFKRRVGMKDTGDLIPGHGGLLDRIDALLLVSPVFCLIIWLWM